MIFEAKGVDGNKKINGRKRQIMVDTQGLGCIYSCGQSLRQRHGMSPVIKSKRAYAQAEKILVDAGYRGLFTELASEYLQVTTEISSRPPTQKGFVPVAKRWVNERTFAWFNFFRRLSKDYQHSQDVLNPWSFWPIALSLPT
ncbi:hypothetical protein DDR33_19235 [Pararcticibacter amylolyticus]|uniref:Transposase IS4-like domain-containing protein n=2 Tax=Pararcticibacter amylolyticus TaxID=2173175 RepID=A0A2U2PCA1_9SPHI|nr:transposase [Pararcticibacter amylolyticus]PWG78985.1 hypothetical protein DDR33_19235 [Pararcticibacter amylolyticus]